MLPRPSAVEERNTSALHTHASCRARPRRREPCCRHCRSPPAKVSIRSGRRLRWWWSDCSTRQPQPRCPSLARVTDIARHAVAVAARPLLDAVRALCASSPPPEAQRWSSPTIATLTATPTSCSASGAASRTGTASSPDTTSSAQNASPAFLIAARVAFWCAN